MSAKPPRSPATLRPFVAYRPPPTQQPTRSASPRDVWSDVSHFLARAAKPCARTGGFLLVTTHRWTTESAKTEPAHFLGEWPAECTTEDFAHAVRLAHERFGKPLSRPNATSLFEGEEFQRDWRVRTSRIDEVLDFLDSVPTCTGGEYAPVNVSFACLLVLRDLKTGVVIPKQGSGHYPTPSMFCVGLQRDCWATLRLTFPFAEPDAAAADYVVDFQEHAPLWLDPRYFDHVVPEPHSARFQRKRLPPAWIGTVPTGELRLDASRSGITPQEVELPTDTDLAAEDPARDDAPFQTNFAAVATALREHSLSTLLIRGADDIEYMVEQAAKWLEIPWYVVRTIRAPKSSTIEEELRLIVSGLDGQRAVLLLNVVSYREEETNAVLLSQMAGRVLLGVELPPELRLVVSVDGEPSDAARASLSLYHVAISEGFGTREQFQFLRRQASRAGWRDVAIEVLPLPQGSH